MNWQLAIIGFYITVTAQALWQRNFAKTAGVSPRLAPAIGYTFGVVPFGIVVSLFGPWHVTHSLGMYLSLVLVAGFITAYNFFNFSALRTNQLTPNQLLANLYVVVAVVGGWLTLHESLSSHQIVGGLLVLSGGLLVIMKRKGKLLELGKESIFAILAGLTLGCALVSEKWSLNWMSLTAYFALGYSAQAIAMDINALPVRKQLASLTRSQFWQAWSIGVLAAVQGFFYIVALKKTNNVGFTTLMASFQIAVAFVASYIFLHERENARRKLFGVVLSSFGVVLLNIH